MIRFLVSILLISFSNTLFAQLEAAQYSIKNLIVNTPYTDMSTSFWGKGRVIFSSSKNSKEIVTQRVKSSENNKAFLEVFQAYIDENYELAYPRKVTMNFDNNFNQSNVSFTQDLEYVYFTSNNQNRSGNDDVILKLYRAKVQKNGDWTELTELPFNSNRYSCAHPTLNEDGTKLYFSSNMPGGYGDTDLYVVDVLPNGEYGKPKNLGGYINTSSKENFPEINNGLLYFSSDKKNGLGGLDVYMVPVDNLFMEPVNLGEPINSKYDDFSFVINGNLRKGFITSDRPQGKGGDDIYSFVQETAIKSCSQIVEIDVLDALNETGIEEAEINIFDEEGKWLNRFMTDVEGKYKIKFNKCDKNYKLEATKKNYSKDLAQIIYQPDKEFQEVIMKLTKEVVAVEETLPEEIVTEEEVVEAVNTVVEEIPEDQLTLDVKNIEFLLNKYDIEVESAEELDKVVKFMKDHPTVVIEFSSHTDSRGPDDWNMELTNLRAQQVVSYLVGKGINYRRVYGKGYGETMPVNHCVNGVECTELEHLQNRRTEFLILAK